MGEVMYFSTDELIKERWEEVFKARYYKYKIFQQNNMINFIRTMIYKSK